MSCAIIVFQFGICNLKGCRSAEAMKILKKTKALKKNKSQLSLAEQVDDTNFARNCQLTCRGKYNWKQKLISVYGSYAMLVEKCFFDLPASLNISYKRHKTGIFIIYFNCLVQHCYGYSLYMNGFMKKMASYLE